MPQPTDAYHGDPSRAHLALMAEKSERVKDLLKTASFDSRRIDDLPSTAFAWEQERAFPVDTKADTVASLLYRSKVAAYEVPEEVDAKLAQAAELWGLEDLVHELHVQAQPRVEKVAAPKAYALPEHQLLPIDTPEQIKVAETTLLRDYLKLPIETRADAFCKVAQAALDHQVELQPRTRRMVGIVATDTRKLAYDLELRGTACKTASLRDSYDRLSDALKAGPQLITDRDEQIKIASVIVALDDAAGLTYDPRLSDPTEAVFNTDKVASDALDVGGTKVPVEALLELPPEVWENVDMPEMVQLGQSGDVEAFKNAFATIPLDIKMLLKDYV